MSGKDRSCPPTGAAGQKATSINYSRLTTQLANERTFLAWIRTGIALLAFGFVVEKAGPFLEALAPEVTERQQNFVSYSGIAGISLMVAGAAVIALATVRFWLIDRSIRRGECETSVALDIVVAVSVTVITIVFIVFLIYQSTIFE
jgi:putative membrane protein